MAHFTLAVSGTVVRAQIKQLQVVPCSCLIYVKGDCDSKSFFLRKYACQFHPKERFIVGFILLRKKVGIPVRDNLKCKQNNIVFFTPSTGVLVCNKICGLRQCESQGQNRTLKTLLYKPLTITIQKIKPYNPNYDLRPTSSQF